MRAFQDMLLKPLKAAVMRAVQQQLSKYIHNIELEELGLLGGDVVLENLEIRKDVLRDSLRIPTDFDFSRGFIKELRIHIPWTRLQSRPIEIKFKTVEIIITPTTLTGVHATTPAWLHRGAHSRQSRSGEEQASTTGATTGWLQQLLTKVLANMSVSVSNLVLKYEDADVVLSAALKSLESFSADPDRNWDPAFAVLDDPLGLLHKLVRASDITICLDRYCAPDCTSRRQVQAFEVPILNRASFDIRLVACVWLVAPGPQEQSGSSSEDQQSQSDVRDGAEDETLDAISGHSGGSPPGVGRARALRETTVSGQASARPTIGALDRLLGVDSRSSGVSGEVSGSLSGRGEVSETAPEAGLTASHVDTAPSATEEEVNGLPLPCVCPMLRNGWRRKTSSSYSPFHDEDGIWSRREKAGDSKAAKGARSSGARQRLHEDEDEDEDEDDGFVGTMHDMPIPTVVADVLIEDLGFSLSNLQVAMMKDLIDRAVEHVAHNASRSSPLEPERPSTSPAPDAATGTRSWLPSFSWIYGSSSGEETEAPEVQSNTVIVKEAPDDRERDSKLVVVSLSVSSLSLSLLEHQIHRCPEGEVVETASEEVESIAVPVHGLGTVSVLSSPTGTRPPLRPPTVFVVMEVKYIALDAHILPGVEELSVDLKLQVLLVMVRHAHSGDNSLSPGKPRPSTESESRETGPEVEPICCWGPQGGEVSVPTRDSASEDPRSASRVRESLLEYLQRLPCMTATLPHADYGATAEESPRPATVGNPLRGRISQIPRQPAPEPTRSSWFPASSCYRQVEIEPAVEYRLLRHKSSSQDKAQDGPSSVASASSSTWHDVCIGPIVAHLSDSLLERLLSFAGVGGEDELDGDKSEENSGVLPLLTPIGSPGQLHSERKRPRQGTITPMGREAGPATSGGGAIVAPVVQPPLILAENSVHLVLRSLDVILDVNAAIDLQRGMVAGAREGSPRFDSPMLVFSLRQAEVDGSESLRSSSCDVSSQAHEQQKVGGSTVVHGESPQRVFNLALTRLSVVFLDEVGPNTCPAVGARASYSHAMPTRWWPWVSEVLAVSSSSTVSVTRRLTRMEDFRICWRNVDKVSNATDPGAGDETRVPRGAGSPVAKHDSVLLEASCEALHVCVSDGAVLLALETISLADKVRLGRLRRLRTNSNVNVLEMSTTSADQLSRALVEGFTTSWRYVALTGTVNTDGGGFQLSGSANRLVVGHVRRSSRVDDAAIFEAPTENASAAISWSLATLESGVSSDMMLTGDVKPAVLYFTKAKEVYKVMKSSLALFEERIGLARLRMEDPCMVRASVADGGGASNDRRDGGREGGRERQRERQRERHRTVHFNIRGSSISMFLPFELKLEVKRGTVTSRQVPRSAVVVERTVSENWSNAGDLVMDLVGEGVQVLHASYGARSSERYLQSGAIQCNARGVVTLKPSTNTTIISLESEHVRVKLTSGTCASFGAFVRYMVGPPSRPVVAGSETARAVHPKSLYFRFELRVREADVDFFADLSSPWALSANLLVGGFSIKQQTTSSRLPGVGSDSSFEMSFKTIDGTQRRCPRLNAPALPESAIHLISAYAQGDEERATRRTSDFLRWVAARKKLGVNPRGIKTNTYIQPFLVALEGSGSARAPKERAFSVLSTLSGPRHRLTSGLTLRGTPMLLVFYPPTVRLLTGHYNRFAGQAFRSFRSRADLPQKRITLAAYDVDIKGSSAVFLASLAERTRGIHVSAEQVRVHKSSSSPSLKPTADSKRASAPPADSRLNGQDAFTMAGLVDPVRLTFVQDWSCLLPAHDVAATSHTANTHVQLCEPVDLRWTISYDQVGRYRQDISLSSIQLYLEQSHFDLCMRLAQMFIAADFPGSLAPKSRSSSSLAPGAPDKLPSEDAALAEGQQRPLLSVVEGDVEVVGTPFPDSRGDGSKYNHVLDPLLDLSLRLPLLQVVLSMGKREGSSPPVLEVDIASVRLSRGGMLTVRHISVNSWPQHGPSPVAIGVDRAALSGAIGGGGGGGYRVFERSGQSEESVKDFLRVEVQDPVTATYGSKYSGSQLDVVIQVEPFTVHLNPSVLNSLTKYATPIPVEHASGEARETPFPSLVVEKVKSFRSEELLAPSRVATDGSEPVASMFSSSGAAQSREFEESAKGATVRAKLLGSQASFVLSSYPGGPAFIASVSHLFVRAFTRSSASHGATRGRSSSDDVDEVGDTLRRGPNGLEIFTRLSRVSCEVVPCHSPVTQNGTAPSSARHASHGDDTVLKPVDIDIHLTSSEGRISGDGSSRPFSRGLHLGINVDDLQTRFGPSHVRSVALLVDHLAPSVAASRVVMADLASSPCSLVSVPQSSSRVSACANDLRALERVEVHEHFGETAVRPNPGQLVLYTHTAPSAISSHNDYIESANGVKEKHGWMLCCEWKYWGLRRIAQVLLPFAPLGACVPLLDGVSLDYLEIELSFLDPLSGKVETAACFKVPCQGSNVAETYPLARPSRGIVEPSKPCFASTWRLAWRVPAWVQPRGGAIAAALSPPASSAWSTAVVEALSVISTPASPAVGPKYVSATLNAQKVTLALLTDGESQEATVDRKSHSRVVQEGDPVQAEEVIRLVLDDMNTFIEAGPSGGAPRPVVKSAVATRGSVTVAMEVQDFSNFLRVPCVSHALVRWDVATSDGGEYDVKNGDGGGNAGDEQHLIPPIRPVASGALEILNGVVSLSSTATQCLSQSIGDFSSAADLERPSGGCGTPAWRKEARGTSSLSPPSLQWSSSPISSPSPSPSPSAAAATTAITAITRKRRKRFVVSNRTARALVFGQVSTNEAILLKPGISKSYRWRTIPAPRSPPESGGGTEGNSSSSLVLMIRLALPFDSNSQSPSTDGESPGRNKLEAWTEPFAADCEGTYVRELRTTSTGDGSLAEKRASAQRAQKVSYLVWIGVSKEGLQTNVELEGEWLFANHLPQEVQVTWATAVGVRNSGTSLVEPPGTHGCVTLAAFDHDSAVGDLMDGTSVSGAEVANPRPDSYSALTPSVATRGTGSRRRASELMLEFRLAAPGANAVVGSVGPPPFTEGPLPSRKGHAWDRRHENEGGRPRRMGMEESTGGFWGVTRQSEWVEAKPGVHLSLISCASTDLGSSGFWFWCAAWRDCTPLSEGRAGTSSGSASHLYNLGQMRIELHPIALLWNQCSQPVRLAFEQAGRRRGVHGVPVGEKRSTGGDAKPDPFGIEERLDAEDGNKQAQRQGMLASARRFASHLEGYTAFVHSGGRVAVCQQPFVDYHLRVLPGDPETTDIRQCYEPYSRKQCPTSSAVPVPSELLSCRCEDQWLPLDRRALNENVLSPLVVVASRSGDSHWPSLSLLVHAGFSIQNFLHVPLSLYTTFSLPSDGAGFAALHNDQGSSSFQGQMQEETSNPDVDEDCPELPLLRGEGARRRLSSSAGDVRCGSSRSSPVDRVVRVFRVPGESLHSAWDICDSEGEILSHLAPIFSLDVCLDLEPDVGEKPSSRRSSWSMMPSNPQSHEGKIDERRTARMIVDLERDLSELVLVPWGAEKSTCGVLEDTSVVLPVVITLSREKLSGGVDLVRLEIHPRVVIHNETNLPMSMVLLDAHAAREDDENGPPQDGCSAHCTVRLSARGAASRVDLLALPERSCHPTRVEMSELDTSRSFEMDSGARGSPTSDSMSSGLVVGLSWLMRTANYKATPPGPLGFLADIELLFGGWSDGAEEMPGDLNQNQNRDDGHSHDHNPARHSEGRASYGIEFKADHGGPCEDDNGRDGQLDDLAVVSLVQPSGEGKLCCGPASLTVKAEGGRRAARVRLAMESSEHSPTEHIVLYQDPQPDLVIWNRSAAPVTVLLDGGTVVEVRPGDTAEHSWPDNGTERSRASAGPQSRPQGPHQFDATRGVQARSSGGRLSRESSVTSPLNSPKLSCPESPASMTSTAPTQRRKHRQFAKATNNPVGKMRAPSNLFGSQGATLRHWFRFKSGTKRDQINDWCKPLWVARGVQLVRFDQSRAPKSGNDEDGRYCDWRRHASEDSVADGGSEGTFDVLEAGAVRDVQVHVVERGGGFVMSFSEGSFDDQPLEVGLPGATDTINGGNGRGVLDEWAKAQEQHLLMTLCNVTIQLLDDSSLEKVMTHREESSEPSTGTDIAAGVVSWGLSWTSPSPRHDGSRGSPSDATPSDAPSAELPAAAIPAILSIFLDGASLRLWRAAPTLRRGASRLDLERLCHLRNHLGIEVGLETLQVDNHVVGHSLPVMFCFREGGALNLGQGMGKNSKDASKNCRFVMSLVLAQPRDESRVPGYVEEVFVRSAPIDVCFEDLVLAPLAKFLERAGLGVGVMDGSHSNAVAQRPSELTPSRVTSSSLLPPGLRGAMMPRLFIQRVDVGALVVRGTIQGYIPGQQVFLSLEKSPLLFRPVLLRSVLARQDEIVEQMASNYAMDTLMRSVAVMGSLEAIGSPTTLLSEWGKGVYDLFAIPMRAVPQGPYSTVRATFQGLSSLIRHASAGTLSSVSGVTNALSRNLGSHAVVRPIAGTMGLVHRTSRSLIASTGVSSEWEHASASVAANPAICRLNADLWYRRCLLPPGHEFLYRTPALCSNASYGQANVPVTIVVSSKAVFLFRGANGCESLWKRIEHEHITLVEQSAEHAPAELILNARAFRRPRSTPGSAGSAGPAGPSAWAGAGTSHVGSGGLTPFDSDESEVGGLLMKLCLPSSACSRQLAQLLQELSNNT